VLDFVKARVFDPAHFVIRADAFAGLIQNGEDGAKAFHIAPAESRSSPVAPKEHRLSLILHEVELRPAPSEEQAPKRVGA
jgi:hypothetical protein